MYFQRPLPSAPEQAEPTGADLGGDVLARALRLGEAALGTPVVFTEAGSAADAGGGRVGNLPEWSVEDSRPVLGLDGEKLGTLRALNASPPGPFGQDAQSALADVAALISNDAAARASAALYDHVTALPNRRRFERRFRGAVEAAGPAPVLMLVTLAEARHYSEILRAFGHQNAETFVRQGAEMVAAAVGPSIALSHVSVLSFAFLSNEADAEAVAREIMAAFCDPVMCGTLPVTTRIGIGLAPIQNPGVRPLEALRRALAAAQDSRRRGHGFAYYDRASDSAHVRAFGLLADLDEALRDYGQLHLAYQPRIDLATGRTIGAEALMRWNHPALGPVPPLDFIPLSESTALIDQLTDFALTRAARQAAAWRRAGLDLRISINISANNLHDSDFLARIDRIVGAAGADPAALEFEVTETVLTSSDDAVRATIDGVRARGIGIAVDDFGMGYSNIGLLTRLPADVMKIDRSLVQSIDQEPRRLRLCKAMIELAQDLEFRVVAEGIETQAEYAILAGWGCDEGQGFFMSRPLPPAEFAAFATAR